MKRFLDLALVALGLQASLVCGQAEAPEPVENPTKSPATLSVKISAAFPDAEIFGIKLVNSKTTRSVLSISNEEPQEVTINFIGGSLWTLDYDERGSQLVRNLTVTKYGINVPGGEQQSLPYDFAVEMQPQDLRLSIAAVVSDSMGQFYTVQAFNGTVAIVEQDMGFLRSSNVGVIAPKVTAESLILNRLFLYLFLMACTGGVFYFAYQTLLLPYFPQLQKKSRGGDRAKKPTKKVEPVQSVAGPDVPAVSTGAKAYDESWIPAHHLQRPEAKSRKSGTPKSKSQAKP